MPVNEARPDRAADQATAHQPERRGGERQRHGPGERVLVLDQLPERGPRAMTTRHRDRSRNETEERVDTHDLREPDADGVLHDRQRSRDAPEQQNLRTSDAEQPEARAEPDGREERHHEGRLQRGVELEPEHAGLPQRQRERREEKAADHRRGDVEAVQHVHAPPDPVADEQHDGRQRHGLNHVEFQCRHAVPCGVDASPRRLATLRSSSAGGEDIAVGRWQPLQVMINTGCSFSGRNL